MFVRRFYDERLAQASYLIGCQRINEAIVIDPPRDIAPILAGAKQEGLRITRVTETHIHADFLSGARELVAATGAEALLSCEGGTDWQYRWPKDEKVSPLHDGDVIQLGGVRITARHTPGHTPEHLSFVITDTARSEIPVAMVSGDFIFVGDVGRPDLLEKAAKVAGTMIDSARQLFRSIAKLSDLPDHLQIWPGHGAGSACGKALGAVPSSTLGYERLSNWAFAVKNEDEFVTKVLEGQPAPPAYFAMMKKMNREGAPLLDGKHSVAGLGNNPKLRHLLETTTVIDVRPKGEFITEHLRGSLSIPLIKAFPTWAGWLVPYDKPITLLTQEYATTNTQAAEALRQLQSIGLDNVQGYWIPRILDQAREEGLTASGHTGDILEAEAMQRGGRLILDIRNDTEWSDGHIPGARHAPLGGLVESLADLPRDTPIGVHCQGGTRSAIGASVLERLGFTDVIDLKGGYGAWRKDRD